MNGKITWNDEQGVSEFAVDTDATALGDESTGNGVGKINDGPLTGAELRGDAMSAVSAVWECFDQGTEITDLAIADGDLAIIVKS